MPLYSGPACDIVCSRLPATFAGAEGWWEPQRTLGSCGRKPCASMGGRSKLRLAPMGARSELHCFLGSWEGPVPFRRLEGVATTTAGVAERGPRGAPCSRSLLNSHYCDAIMDNFHNTSLYI